MSIDQVNSDDIPNLANEENDPIYLKNVIVDLKKTHLNETNELRVY